MADQEKDKTLSTIPSSPKERWEVPDYQKPYLDVSDLDQVDITPVGGDQVNNDYFNSGSEALKMDGKDVSDEIEENYRTSYEKWLGSEEHLDKDAQKAFDKMQDAINKENRDRAMIPPKVNKKDKEDFIQQWKQKAKDEAAMTARRDAFMQVYGNNIEAGKAATDEAERIMKEQISENAMKEAISYMKNANFEYLTRGAILICSSGGVMRRLNLPVDHGIFFGNTQSPVVNKSDCLVGDEANIANFGLCTGINHPTEYITLDVLVPTDKRGRYLSEHKADTIDRGYLCTPNVAMPGWINTWKETDMGMASEESVSTKSFLVCIHGGIIYPVNSGQHAEQEEKLNNAMMKQEFDTCFVALDNLKEAEANLNKIKYEDMQGSYGKLYSDKPESKSNMEQLSEVQDAQNGFWKKVDYLMDQVRSDSYGESIGTISPERGELIEYMLGRYAEEMGGEVPSLKDDYERYWNRYGSNSQGN